MRKFEIGKTYTTIGSFEHDYTVIARTAATITITDGNTTKRCRIVKRESEWNKAETIKPLGDYSAAPILAA